MSTLTEKKADRRGFTLIELLIVIGIIGFLAAAVLVAVDPVKRIQDARDARRFAEVNGILNAILNKQVDDRALYAGATTAPVITQSGSNVQVIVTSDTGIECGPTSPVHPGCNKAMDTTAASPQKNCVVNLSDATTTPLIPNYIASAPHDPRGDGQTVCVTGCTTNATSTAAAQIGATNTGYYLARTSGNRLEIGACLPEDTTTNPTISVKR